MSSSKNLIVNSSMRLLETMNSRDYQEQRPERHRFPTIGTDQGSTPKSRVGTASDFDTSQLLTIGKINLLQNRER